MPSAEDQATLQAHFAGVDATAIEMEAKWGVDRLPLLVDPELRARFERQRVKLREALTAAWSSEFLTRDQIDRVASSSAAMIRAWSALDTAAEVAGHRPVIAHVWEVALADGSVAALVRTDAEVRHVIAEGRHLRVFTLAEVGNLFDAMPEILCKAKEVFPGAKVMPKRSAADRAWATVGDEIPF